MYRVENAESKLMQTSVGLDEFKYNDTEMKRMKCKAYAFTIVDFLLTIITFTTFMKFYSDIHKCFWDFDIMLGLIAGFSSLSFFSNFYQLYLLKR